MSDKTGSCHVPGRGCQCGAYGEYECGCEGVDWRSRKEVELEKRLPALEAERDALKTALKKAVEAFNDIKKKAEFQVEIATEADKVVATAGQITYAVAVIMSDPTLKRLMAEEGR